MILIDQWEFHIKQHASEDDKQNTSKNHLNIDIVQRLLSFWDTRIQVLRGFQGEGNDMTILPIL